MNVFVIHRFDGRKQVRKLLRKSAKELDATLKITLLDSAEASDWKNQAVEAISRAEVVVVYDRTSCEASEYAKWEIETAEGGRSPVIEIEPNDTSKAVSAKLKPIYDLEEEFRACFANKDGSNTLELYKLMIDSSESLIGRRHKTNAFFITAIGSLLAITGLMVKTGALNSDTIWLLYGLSIVGLLLCKSWRNLIDNYGKLNKAKFDVILRLEKNLDAQIFGAEWIALGKGLRPRKYKSFTSTEKNVPLYFGLLILILTVMSILWQVSTSKIWNLVVCWIWSGLSKEVGASP